MIRTIAVRRVVLTGAAALITLVVTSACGGAGGMDHGSQPMTSAPAGAMHNDADVAFVQMMIPHHQQAVEMATLADTRAKDPELKSLAAKVKSAQEPEIATMTGWLTSRGLPTAQAGGHNMPGMGSMPGMMSDEEMAELKAASGVDFDRMFARMMIAHHNGAIQMCRDATAQGSDAEIKALAATIEKDQSAEVAELQAILDRL
jgi:uncharacterized protein (DUF305 family)